MEMFMLFTILAVVNCAPTPIEDVTEKIIPDAEVTETSVKVGVQEDTREASNEKNPVQEWFENLSKNASTNTQKAMDSFKDWITKLTQNSNNNLNGGSQNLPTMYMGSFQLLKMPMPQFGDIVKGMGDLATMAQAFNKVTGGLPQGLPLVPQKG